MDARISAREAMEHATPALGHPSSLASPVANQHAIAKPQTIEPAIPDYLQEIYEWAYLNPTSVKLLDHEFVVSIILWGQHRHLRDAAFAELKPGQHVLQPTSVYGDFLPILARHLGPQSRLEVTDIAPVQIESCRRKLAEFPNAVAHLGDARFPGDAPYDAVCCYFLMHELPEDYKHEVVDGLLASVAPGGKVVFIDYHKPHWAHPLKAITSLVFDTLEPFAKSLWRHEISDFASHAGGYRWRKQTSFGGLFQKVVAERLPWT